MRSWRPGLTLIEDLSMAFGRLRTPLLLHPQVLPMLHRIVQSAPAIPAYPQDVQVLHGAK